MFRCIDDDGNEMGEEWIEYQSLQTSIMFTCREKLKLKAKMLYHILQDGSGGQEQIAFNDKDMKPTFYKMLNIAVKAPIIACGDSNLINNLNDDNWDEVFEDFVDKVYDADSILPRTNFERNVRKNYPALFNPAAMRQMVKVTADVPSDDEHASDKDSDTSDE